MDVPHVDRLHPLATGNLNNISNVSHMCMEEHTCDLKLPHNNSDVDHMDVHVDRLHPLVTGVGGRVARVDGRVDTVAAVCLAMPGSEGLQGGRNLDENFFK